MKTRNRPTHEENRTMKTSKLMSDAASRAVMNKFKLGRAIAGLTAALLMSTAGTAAWGAVIPVANPGFEDLLVVGTGVDGNYDYATDPSGGYTYRWPLPNWGYYGQDYSGLLNPTAAMITGEAPEGQCVGFVEADTRANPGPLTGGLRQVLGLDLAPDATYMLTVKVGNPPRVDYAFNTFPGYRVQLWAGGILLAEDANTLTVPLDEWVTSTVVYASGPAVTPGQKLEIRLANMGISPGGSGRDHYVLYDDVQLTATLVHPIAVPGGPYKLGLGGSLSLNGSGSLPSPALEMILRYSPVAEICGAQ